jgi:hypothetical protein
MVSNEASPPHLPRWLGQEVPIVFHGSAHRIMIVLAEETMHATAVMTGDASMPCAQAARCSRCFDFLTGGDGITHDMLGRSREPRGRSISPGDSLVSRMHHARLEQEIWVRFQQLLAPTEALRERHGPDDEYESCVAFAQGRA